MPTTIADVVEDVNLLRTPLFSVRYDDTQEEDTLPLPGLLAAHSQGRPVGLTACQSFQRMAVHAFLTQLAAFTLVKAMQAGSYDPAEGWGPLSAPEWWTKALGDLTSAWHLIPKGTEAAFCQPPEKDTEGWKRVLTPDEVESRFGCLNSAPNHSLKHRTIVEPRPEHWVYALISVQTQSGSCSHMYPRGARVPGSGRLFVGLAPSLNWGLRFRRDVLVWHRERQALARRYRLNTRTGLGILWETPFGRRLSLNQLDPCFIDLCRRVRLEVDKRGRVLAWMTPCNDGWVIRDEGQTITDIWCPILPAEKSRGPGPLSFKDLHYDALHKVLFQSSYGPALHPLAEDGDAPLLIASGIARDKSKTIGFHQRHVPVSPSVMAAYRTAGDYSQLGVLSTSFLEVIQDVDRKMLKPAVATLAESSPKNFKPLAEEAISKRFEQEIDRIYFERLFSGVTDPEMALTKWAQELLDLATVIVTEAVKTLPLPPFTRWKWAAQTRVGFRVNKAKCQEKLCPSPAQ